MKSYSFLPFWEFCFVFIMETFHVAGTAFLFLVALPELDTLQGVIASNSVAVIPCLLKIIFIKRKLCDLKAKLCFFIWIFALFIQIGLLVGYFALDELGTKNIQWALPVGLIFTSCGWWECYVKNSSWMGKIKKKMTDGTKAENGVGRSQYRINLILFSVKATDEEAPSRGPTYFLISLWKILLFLLLMFFLVPNVGIITDTNTLYTKFSKSFKSYEYIIVHSENVKILVQEELKGWDTLLKSQSIVILVQICSSWFLYSISKFAIKCHIKNFGYALPMTLATPVCLSAMTLQCAYRKDICANSSFFSKHLYYTCPANYFENKNSWVLTDQDYFTFLTGLLLILSLGWITKHIWVPQEKGLFLDVSQIFSKYYYSSLMVDVSLMLNKRKIIKKDKSVSFPTPKVYGCATMWHETTEEIEVFLRSIFNIDEDVCVRKLKKMENLGEKDYYEWESHVFFDDCMTVSESKNDEGKTILNSYVIDFIETVAKYGKEWYDRIGVPFPKATKIVTPYGGRMIWSLPGGTELIVHLKDKEKIRHKKR